MVRVLGDKQHGFCEYKQATAKKRSLTSAEGRLWWSDQDEHPFDMIFALLVGNRSGSSDLQRPGCRACLKTAAR